MEGGQSACAAVGAPVVGGALATLDGVHAVTDVTGYGLLGHLLEICRGSGLSAEIRYDDLPFFPDTLDLARAGHTTDASTRNRASYGSEVRLPADWADEQAVQAFILVRVRFPEIPSTSSGFWCRRRNRQSYTNARSLLV